MNIKQDTGPESLERAFCIGLKLAKATQIDAESSLDELAELLRTAGAEVEGSIIVKRDRPDPRTLIGKGKIEEIIDIIGDIDIDVLVFDQDLTPGQQNNLATAFDMKILDRTAVILDIFAQHAHTSEGKLQVELAQLKYMLGRLTGKGIEMSRLGGGIGTRGPGETKLEADRRRIRKRIDALEEKLDDVARHRKTQRKKRKPYFAISLVGYTNAGKSTLLNAVTKAQTYAEDQLFATLDSLTKRLEGETGARILISDTVGFIDRLPPQLIAAFSSTLEEIGEADLILHVIDASAFDVDRQITAVEKILDDLGFIDIPIIRVFNKSDLLPEDAIADIHKREPEAIVVSAMTGRGIDALIDSLNLVANEASRIYEFEIPYDRGELVDLLHNEAIVLHREYTSTGTLIKASCPDEIASRLTPYLCKKQG